MKKFTIKTIFYQVEDDEDERINFLVRITKTSPDGSVEADWHDHLGNLQTFSFSTTQVALLAAYEDYRNKLAQ